MEFEEIPRFIAFALAFFGMASPVWHKLHRVMFVIYLVLISFTQFYFKPPSVELVDLPFLGAILSGSVGIYLAFFANIYPEKADIKQGKKIFIAYIIILFTFICEIAVQFTGGYLFDPLAQKQHYFLMERYTPSMVCLALLQSLILFKGGIDGLRHSLISFDEWINDLSSRLGGTVQNRKVSGKLQNGGKKL